MSAHRHANPSPSHCIAAWCNGTTGDPGCGQVVPLYHFKDRRQDDPPHESYFIDGRDPNAVLTALENLVRQSTPRWSFPRGELNERLQEIARRASENKESA